MAVSMTSTHLHTCQHHRGGSATRIPVTTLQQQTATSSASIHPPVPPSSTGVVLPSGPALPPNPHQYPPHNRVNSIQHQQIMSIPPPAPPTTPLLHSAPPPLPPPPLPPGVPPPLLGIANMSNGGKIIHHGNQNHRITVSLTSLSR